MLALAFVAKPFNDLAQAQLQNRKNQLASPQSMSDVLTKLLKLKVDSYHVFLRDASLLVPPVVQGQDWAEVQKLMQKHSFRAVEAWENGGAVHSYHLLKSKAFTFPNGQSLDLYLLLSAPNLDNPRLPARAGRLYGADVALVADINAPYRRVIGEKRYPQGSVLDAVLNAEKVKEVGEVWPLLKMVYVHYGYIGNHRIDLNPSGFHVSIEFTASAKMKIAGKAMSFYVASGLDPLRSWDGKERVLRGFVPQDTLDEFMYGGGNEWWHGDDATIEVNKRKYLKIKR